MFKMINSNTSMLENKLSCTFYKVFIELSEVKCVESKLEKEKNTNTVFVLVTTTTTLF